jgi:phospholipid/cholesterol/gamma-HCH transport system substrate-binding protein
MSKELKIGLFVTLILVASFFLINYLRGKDLFNKEMELSSRYENVEGLVASAPVYIKGYKAGKVTEVSYDNKSDDFTVTCSVLRDFNIPVDSKMIIYGVDIMGGKGIRIELGTSVTMVEDGGVLGSASEPALLDGIASGLTPILDNVGRILDSLNVAVSGVNNLLSANNQAAISGTLKHLENAMQDISRLTALVEGHSTELDDFITDLASLSDKMGGIADKIDSTMTGVSSVVSSIDESDIVGVVSSFRSLLENMNDPDSTIGRLFTDDSVYESVDCLLNDVDSLIRKIEENPKKYIKISVF